MGAGFQKMIVLAVAASVVGALPACGEDDSDDVGTTGIDIDIPTATTPATTVPPEEGERSGDEQPSGDEQRVGGDQSGREKQGKAKEKGSAPEVSGGLPKPSKRQQQQIDRCIEEAEGDPEKIAACGRILDE